MKVLFFYQHFWPDSPPYANMLRVIAAGLAEAGHEASVLTAQPSYKAEDRAGRSPARERLDGVDVRRLAPLALSGRVPLLRTIGKALFPLRASLATIAARLRGERQDVIVAATIPPVVNGLSALLAARLSGARFVYHLQDIYPEIGAAGGLWRAGSWRHRLLLALDTFTARHADRCVVLSEDMRSSLVARGLDDGHVVVLNNFMLSDFGSPTTNSSAVRAAADVVLGSSGRRRIVFAGNLGRFQGLETVLEGFLSLDAERLGLELHFLGEGAVTDTLRQLAGDDARVRFHGHLPFRSASRLIEACDAGIVSIAPDIYRYAYPSKTLTYLGLGVPVLAVVEPTSALAAEIRRHRLGVVVEERTSEGLARAFTALALWLDSEEADRVRIRDHARAASSAAVALVHWRSLIDGLGPAREALEAGS